MALPIARQATRVSLPLVGAFMVGAIAYGGLYTFPAISIAFADEFGISRTLAVTPWTMFLLVTALASPLLGRAYDEFADRDLLTASMVLLAAGWLAVYLAGDISLVILAYAVFMAIGLQLAFIGTSTAVARRYAGMSGLALGIAYAGPGIGVAVALPVAAGLIETAGWRETALVFMASSLVGVLFVWMMTSGPAIVVPAPGARRAARARKAGSGKPPTRSGRRYGEPLSAGQSALRAAEAGVATRASGLHETSAPGAVSAAHEIRPAGSQDRPRSVRRTVRTRRFWILFAGAAAIGVFDEGVLQAFIPGAVDAGIRAEAAAAALGIQALTYVAGQVVGGWLSDRFGRRVVGLAAAVMVGGGVVAAIGLVARTRPSPWSGSRSTASGPARRSPSGRRRSATCSVAPTSGRSSGCSRSPIRSAARWRSMRAPPPTTRPARTRRSSRSCSWRSSSGPWRSGWPVRAGHGRPSRVRARARSARRPRPRS